MKCVVKNNSSMDMGPLLPLLKSLLPYTRKKLGFNRPPSLFFASDTENASKPLGKTAFYDPSEASITIFVDGRHPKDILRSISHELVHHMQHERGDFGTDMDTGEGYAQKNDALRELEREAYESGNMCFRDWEDENRQALQEAKQHFDRKNKKMSANDKRNDKVESLLMEKWGFKHQREEGLNIDVPVRKSPIKKTISEDFIRDIIKRAISSSKNSTLNELDRPTAIETAAKKRATKSSKTGTVNRAAVDAALIVAIKESIDAGIADNDYAKIQQAGTELRKARVRGVSGAEQFWEQLINGDVYEGQARLQHDIAVRAIVGKGGLRSAIGSTGMGHDYFLNGEYDGIFFVSTVEEFRAMETDNEMPGQESSRLKAAAMLNNLDPASTNYAHELFKNRWNIIGRSKDAGGTGVGADFKDPSRMPLTFGLLSNDAYNYLTTKKEKWTEEKNNEKGLWNRIARANNDSAALAAIEAELLSEPDFNKLGNETHNNKNPKLHSRKLKDYAKKKWTQDWLKGAPKVNINRDYGAPAIKDPGWPNWFKSWFVGDPAGKVASGNVEERLEAKYDTIVTEYPGIEDAMSLEEFYEIYNDHIEYTVKKNELVNANKFFNYVRIGHQSLTRKASGPATGRHDVDAPFAAVGPSFFELFSDDKYQEILIPKDFSDASMNQIEALSRSFSDANIQTEEDVAAWAATNLTPENFISGDDIMEKNIANAIAETYAAAETIGVDNVEEIDIEDFDFSGSPERESKGGMATGRMKSGKIKIPTDLEDVLPGHEDIEALRNPRKASPEEVKEALIRKVVQEALKRKFGE